MTSNKPKILIIDDEMLLRKSLKRILERAGFEVETALDFESAKKCLKNSPFDLLIVDIILPQINGIEMIRRFQDELEDFKSAIIFITGEPNLETAVQAIRLGAYDFLEKPVDRDILLQTINQTLLKRNAKITFLNTIEEKTFTLDDSFLLSELEVKFEDFKSQAQVYIDDIYEALLELKKKFGDSFTEDQKKFLNKIAANNNKMRKLWLDK